MAPAARIHRANCRTKVQSASAGERKVLRTALLRDRDAAYRHINVLGRVFVTLRFINSAPDWLL